MVGQTGRYKWWTQGPGTKDPGPGDPKEKLGIQFSYNNINALQDAIFAYYGLLRCILYGVGTEYFKIANFRGTIIVLANTSNMMHDFTLWPLSVMIS